MLRLAILVITATCASAYADGSSAPPPAELKPSSTKASEEPVAPTGLIIAGVALAAFALVLLLGRRKRKDPPPSQVVKDLAEVLVVIESDERATVWTRPTLKVDTDRQGEAVLHLPLGKHVISVQIGAEVYTRAIELTAIKKMRIAINIAKERITNTSSGQMAAAARPQASLAPEAEALVSSLPVPQKAATSAARAYPDAASQGKLGKQLAGLIDVELDGPKAAAPKAAQKVLDMEIARGTTGEIGAIDFSPLTERQKSPTRPPPVALTLDLGDSDDVDLAATPPPQPPAMSPAPAREVKAPTRPPPVASPAPIREVKAPTRPPVSALADVPARNQPPTSALEGIVKTAAERAPLLPKPPAPKASLSFDELDDLAPSHIPPPVLDSTPVTSPFELAPPQKPPAAAPVRGSVPSFADFAIDEMVTSKAPPAAMPKVTATSVTDLTLDDDDLPIQRVPVAPRTASKPLPSIDKFALDDASDDLETAPGPGLGLIHDRYRRLAAIGPGPLGSLFRGRDEAAKRDIMIEEVSRDVALSAPASALGALSHANLVKFYGHVIDGAAAYLITELVEGKSLKQQLAERGSFASLEAIGIIDQVCAGLGAAHDRNVFHRGVRPDCIVMSGRTAKLTGFAWGPAARSLPYTAPELVGGGAADTRSDLYSIGVTLAELLTGAVPVPGKLEFPSDVPRTLASLVRKLLSREPTIRPASVKAVRDAFSAVF